MKTLLWLGNFFFYPALKELLTGASRRDVYSGGFWEGPWQTVWHEPAAGHLLTWQDCVRIAGVEPDMVIVGDTSRPPFVLGVEKFPCLTVLYAVDTHIHSWLSWYGQAFDACLISLKDHMEFFRHKILPEDRLWWSPPYSRPVNWTKFPQYLGLSLAAEARPLPCVFVGSMDATRMPLRHHFFSRLAELVPQVRVVRGAYEGYYTRARIVVNICEHGDMNFRIFESMGCGAALVTPVLGHGLGDIFQAGIHMQTFDVARFGSPDSPLPSHEAQAIAVHAAESAAAHILELLRDDAQRLNLARHGCAEVHRAHRAIHRAQVFMQRVAELPTTAVEQRHDKADIIRKTCLKLPYLHWSESLDSEDMRQMYIKAARGEV